MVVLEQASQSLSAEHARTFFRSQIVARCEQQNVPFTLVVSLGVIMLNELSNCRPAIDDCQSIRNAAKSNSHSLSGCTEWIQPVRS